MKKLIVFVLLLSMFFGCQHNVDDSISEESLLYAVFDDYISISCPIERYYLVMSSVPGLPIGLKTLQDLEGYTIEISSSTGTLLLMNGGIIDHLDGDYSFDYQDNTVYWSPLEDMSPNSDVTIKVKFGDEVVAKANCIITKDEGGYVFMQTVFTE